MQLSHEQILVQGFVDLQLRVGGILQTHRFVIVTEKTTYGQVSYLEVKANVVASELAKIAKQLDFPVRSPLGTAFPPGKSSKDFATTDFATT